MRAADIIVDAERAQTPLSSSRSRTRATVKLERSESSIASDSDAKGEPQTDEMRDVLMVARLDALLERKSADEAVDRAREAMRKKPKRPGVNVSGREGGRRGRGVAQQRSRSMNLGANFGKLQRDEAKRAGKKAAAALGRLGEAFRKFDE